MHVLNCMCYFLLLAIKINSAFLLHEKLLETYGDMGTLLLTAECSSMYIWQSIGAEKFALTVLRTFATSQHEKNSKHLSFRSVIFI
jgi:hypothetical protein